ncbi:MULTISPECIES: M56 family metallopeptidase [unclassified Cellulophaga]|uniref:M56 family metallopeptidase n=1 Tax=unclassified Cellulophaga TaxID=2634405 RepID=UPI0026E1B178|nr:MULTISPECIES: M56 family metallopeptidase [unclassified Cellulophaga]MDO6489966.1 M56 family metallopeptidase [Cellulophaga sp. 2_MG-2023]MDO6494840.1 M56 family metallopeptidase [Cellulophaga sp. 3_MG-2023]
MEYLIFIAKSSLVIALFFICFQMFLRNETFFKANRLFLLAGIFVAMVFPFLIITKVVFINAPIVDFNKLSNTVVNNSSIENINWWLVVLSVYVVGCVFFLGRFLVQLASLFSLINKGTSTRVGRYKMVEVTADTSAFSFFNFIVYNPNLHTANELKTIIKHEELHAKQKHSLDMLLTHLLCVLQWANPFAWWYKKMVSVNLEYLVDDAIVSHQNKKEYQYLLLQQSVHSMASLSVTNTFFNSLVKKRIVMLNKSKSRKESILKMGLVVPMLFCAVVVFNTETIAQSKPVSNDLVSDISKVTIVKNRETIGVKDSVKTIESKAKKQTQTVDIQLKEKQTKVSNTYNFQIENNVQTFITPVSMTTPIREAKTPENSYLTSKKPLIIVNGEVMPSSFDMNLLIPENIEHINIFKNQSAIDRFGKKGENGVVEITTKK